MPGYVIHLAVAKEYAKKHKKEIENYNKFIDGVIYPDSVTDKSITHYGAKSSKVNLKEFLLQNNIEDSYNKGYFLHLVTDYLFYNKFLDYFSNDIYNDYDILNEFLEQKYDVNIPISIQNYVFYKKGETKILNLKDIIEFINKVSSYNLCDIKNMVLKDDIYWNTFKELKNLN